jgi:iron(II)-dependent oxidoreductase
MTRDEIGVRLDEARARTLLLVDSLTEEDLHRQHDVLMSPIIWDLGHIAHFEELWLIRNLEGPVSSERCLASTIHSSIRVECVAS